MSWSAGSICSCWGFTGPAPVALMCEGTKPCSLGPGKGSGRASSGTHVTADKGEPWPRASPAPRDPYSLPLSTARDLLLPTAAAASGGVWCAAFLGLASCLDPLPGGIHEPGAPELFQLSERVPPSEGTRVSSLPVPTCISASCKLHKCVVTT